MALSMEAMAATFQGRCSSIPKRLLGKSLSMDTFQKEVYTQDQPPGVHPQISLPGGHIRWRQGWAAAWGWWGEMLLKEEAPGACAPLPWFWEMPFSFPLSASGPQYSTTMLKWGPEALGPLEKVAAVATWFGASVPNEGPYAFYFKKSRGLRILRWGLCLSEDPDFELSFKKCKSLALLEMKLSSKMCEYPSKWASPAIPAFQCF